MRISDWSSDVCSSDLGDSANRLRWVIGANYERTTVYEDTNLAYTDTSSTYVNGIVMSSYFTDQKMKNYAAFGNVEFDVNDQVKLKGGIRQTRSEEHTSELQSLMRISYAVFCLQKNKSDTRKKIQRCQ